MAATSSRAFKIHGMDCAEEVAVLKREVGPAVGGEELLLFDILNGKMSVAGADNVSTDTILRAVAHTGLRAEPWQEGRGKLTPIQASGAAAAGRF